MEGSIRIYIHNLILQLQMQTYLSKSGREIWHVDYFNWIVSRISQEIRACSFIFLKCFSMWKCNTRIYPFCFLSVPLLHHYFSLGQNVSSSFLCETIHSTAKVSFDQVSITIKGLLFKNWGLYTLVQNMLLCVLLVAFIFDRHSVCGFTHVLFFWTHDVDQFGERKIWYSV